MRRCLVAVVFAFVPSAFVPSAFAENPDSVGRLPDGRPYRVDENGYKLSDHIADLEVTVNDLQNQVQSLEYELEQKNRDLESAGMPVTPSSKLKKQAGGVAQAQCPLAPSCDAMIQPLRLRISQLEGALSQRPTPSFAPSSPPPSCDDQTKPL